MDAEDNYNLQIQEIEVLKSIYGEDLFSEQDLPCDDNSSSGSNGSDSEEQSNNTLTDESCDNSSHSQLSKDNIGKKIFNIKISIDLPKDFQIFIKENEENQYQHSIMCLPNVNLGFSYPVEYPSTKPPKLYFSSCWLNLDNMNLVVQQFYSLWEKDELVIFKLVDWVKNSLLEYLKFGNGIILDNEPIDFDSPLWDQGISWNHESHWTSMLSVLPTLRSFNSHEGRRLFSLNNQICSICDFEGNGNDFTLFKCLHHICNDCVKNIININIKSNEFSLIKCPELKCKELFDLEYVEKYCEKKEDVKKYEDYLKQSKGLVRCVRCEKGWSYVDHLTRSTFCTSCYYSFCILCRGPFHPGMACNFTSNTSDGIPISKLYIGQLRVCLCGAMIEKREGCNKVICIVCNTKFCWICSKPNIDYDHFGKKCQLFEIPHERGPRNRGIVGGTARVGAVDASTTCTKCKQIVYRHSNSNSVYCYGCETRLCFLCKNQIKGTRHFIYSSCTQNGTPQNWKADRTYRFFGPDQAPDHEHINQDLRYELFR